MFEPQGFSELHYNLPADGERVCALQSLIGSFWSRALFLIPPRTWYKTYSPSCRERPNRNQRTNTPAGFACFIIAVGWGKSRKKGFSFSSWYFFFFLSAWHFNWCLETMLTGFGTEAGCSHLISAWFFSTWSCNGCNSLNWVIYIGSALRLKNFNVLNFAEDEWMERIKRAWFSVRPPFICYFPNAALSPHTNAEQWFVWSVFVVMLLPSISTDTTLDFPFWICAFPEWLASQKIYPPAMEEAQAAEGEVDRALGEEAPGVVALRVGRGCTSSRWPREPGPWPCTTPYPSGRAA